MDEPLIDLAADAEPRHWVRAADGTPHYLATFDDLGINARREIARSWQRILELESKEGDLTKAEEREHDQRNVAIVRRVLPTLPVREVKAMGREKREAVVQAFFANRLVHRVMQQLARVSVTGDESSPSASAPTEEPTPGNG